MVKKSSKSGDVSNSQNVRKSAKNKGLTASKGEVDLAQNKPSKVPTADKANSIDVPNSDKLNNKLSDKPVDLALVAKAWPQLPEDIRSAIVAIVRASEGKNRG